MRLELQDQDREICLFGAVILDECPWWWFSDTTSDAVACTILAPLGVCSNHDKDEEHQLLVLLHKGKQPDAVLYATAERDRRIKSMQAPRCWRCYTPITHNGRLLRWTTEPSLRRHLTVTRDKIDVKALLSKPSWSVRSLLPSASDAPSTEVTREQLRHLLRLSALPQPRDTEHEDEMLKTLHSQLHFVKAIQRVDTDGVEPLVSIRDETQEAQIENTIGLETLKEALGNEDIQGKNRRPRRRRDLKVDTGDAEDWDVLGTASRKVGKYFVVDCKKDGGQASSKE